MLIAGVDEVGRGPLAGPVVVAAVILDDNSPIIGLADSKKLSPKRREQLFSIIRNNCLCWTVGRAEVKEIDELNILQATFLAMQRAVELLPIKPELVLVDGNCCPQLPYPARAIIRGDATVPAISAASILAKVIRDSEMEAYDKYYPQYGFAKHKGYGTKEHLEALKKYKPAPMHRHSFTPIKNMI